MRGNGWRSHAVSGVRPSAGRRGEQVVPQGRERSFLDSNGWTVMRLVVAVWGAASSSSAAWVRVVWLVIGAGTAWGLVRDLVRRRRQRGAGVADVRD